MVDTADRDTHRFETDHDVSEAIREALAEARDEDPADIDVRLYDDINPDGLDNLLWTDAQPVTSVELTTNAVKVQLWGDGSFEIQVLDEDAET